MINRDLSVYCIQETWLHGNFIKEIEGYTVFHHGLKKQVCSRGQNGVVIILSPDFTIFIINLVRNHKRILKILIVSNLADF